MSQFKAGDKVYYPTKVNKIVEVTGSDGNAIFAIRCLGEGLTGSGRVEISDINPVIYHATEDNHEKLEAFYNSKFEEPNPTGSDLTRGILESGNVKLVICHVSNYTDNSARMDERVKVITGLAPDGFYDSDGKVWEYAVPLNNRGKEFRG